MSSNIMRSSNPALGDKTFSSYEGAASGSDVMTIDGAVNKTGILLLLVILAASFTWHQYFQTKTAVIWVLIGGFGGFIVGLITSFKKEWAPVTAPLYAVLEGLFLGGISAIYESLYNGLVLQAIGLTFGTLFCLLMAYKSGMIKATENFKLGVVAATGAIFVVNLVSMVLGFFKINIPGLFSGGPVSIIFSLVVVVVAALNLVLDFDFIEKGAEMQVPNYMEWYAGFGLMVTLIWLYLEILRLLSYLRGRD